MKNAILALIFSLLINCSPTEDKPADLPMAVSNNALTSLTVDGKRYVYTFGGMGAGKTHKDITLRSFRYSLDENLWEELPPLPDTMPKIAAAASVVKDKIYIIGGYYVFPDGHEKSHIRE